MTQDTTTGIAIPEDVLRKAHDVMVDGVWLADDTTTAFDAARETIARAIMAERERCAKIALAHPGITFENSRGHIDWRKADSFDIAAAIRTPTEGSADA